MADQKQFRVTATRYRVGYVAATVDPVWVSFYAPSAGALEIIKRGNFTGRINARLRAGRMADIWPGDVLVLSLLGAEAQGRALLVEQVDYRGANLEAQCLEVARPIPDEFTDTGYAGYWTDLWGGVPDVVEGTSQLQLAGLPNVTNAGSLHGLYQNVIGDFDCWTKADVPAGGGGAVYRGLLGARLADNSKGCWVGIRDNGSRAAVRIDQTSSSAQTETVGASADFIRIKREGTSFRTYYAAGPTEPTGETAWTEIGIPASGYVFMLVVTTIQVGLGGYRENGSSGAVLKFDYLRNWRPAGA